MSTAADSRSLATNEPDWDNAPAFGRRDTLLNALRRLHLLHPGPACIVETGTLRDGNPGACSGDGWSTLAFGWYAAQTGGVAYTVDVNDGAIATCRRMTEAYAEHIRYVVEDSVAFLAGWNGEARGRIDLLYLDSLDYFDRPLSEAHCLSEARSALPSLASACLVLIDDTSATGGVGLEGVPALHGKGTLAVPYLLSEGFRMEFLDGGQVLLSRGATE